MIDKKTIDLIKLSKLCDDVLTNNNNKINLIKQNAEFFIQNFLVSKENNIPNNIFNSSDFKLEFSISKSKTLIWDMFFIGEYILNQLPEEERKKIEKISSSNVKISLKNLKPLIVVEKTNEFKELKKSIVIIELLYKYINENNYKNNINNEELSIKFCDTSYNIPIEYLGEFSRGIIPVIKDKNLAEKIDEKVLKLSYNLNINYKELPNFYYRTNIDRINFLSELVNDNQQKLNNLPYSLFSSAIPLSWIKKVYKLVDNDINKLMKLPNSIFIEQPYIEYLKELLSLTENDIDALSKLPSKAFSRNSNIERIKKLIANTNKKKVTDLYNLPNSVFICSEKRLEFFILRTKSNLNKTEYLAPQAFSSNTTEERLLLLINLVNENYQLLKDINVNAYTTSNKRFRFILQLIDNDINKLKNIPTCWFNEKTTSEKRIKYLFDLIENNIDVITSLPKITFNESITDEQRIEYLYKLADKKVDKFKNLPPILFNTKVTTNRIKELLKLSNNKIEELNNIPTILFPTKLNIKKYNIILERVTNKKEFALEDYKLIFPFIKNNIIDEKFIYQRLSHLIKNIEDITIIPTLPEHLFKTYTSNIRITFLLDIIKRDLSKLSLIPKELYLKHIKVTRIITIFNLVGRDLKKLTDLPKEMYTFPKESLSVLYKLHLNNKAKPLIGIGDSKSIITILYMLVAFSDYKEPMASPNQQLNRFTISKPENILTKESDSIKEALFKVNEIIQQLPKVLISNSKKDFKLKLIKDIKKVNTSILTLDKIISNQNHNILTNIKNSLLKLRLHINGNTIILEDYEVLEDSYRNHTFKIEGNINDYADLTKSLLVNKRLLSNKEYTIEIYNRLSPNTKKTYGKRFINTLLNDSLNYKKICSSIISAQSKLHSLNITDITFYIEDDAINIGYIIGKKKHYSEIKDLQKDLTNIKTQK